jgi:hypothetical protein
MESCRLPNPARFCHDGRMAEFLNHNATAVFSLIGVLAGGILSFLASWLLRRRDLQMKIWERFLDRRISAH